jgi:hypothetical protein
MPVPATGPIDVNLSLFSSLVTETAPTDLPEGCSPENQDVIFVPGSVASRPCLHKVFPEAFGANVCVNHEAAYLPANGSPLNLYLDSNGVLHSEDPVKNPGAYITIGQVVPGAFSKSVNLAGKHYFAFNDGLHGVDTPRQFDGTFFDRVSQDGPGASPEVAEYLPPAANLTGAGAGAAVNIASITPTDKHTTTHEVPVYSGGRIIEYREYSVTVYNTMTLVTAAPHGLAVGQTVAIAGSLAQFNTSGKVVSVVVDATTIKLPYNSSNATAAGAAGTVTPQAPSLVRQSNQVTANTAAAHGFLPGWKVTIALGAGWDGTFIIQQVPSPTTFQYSQVAADALTSAAGTATPVGQISAGVHNLVMMYLTRQGYITKPSSPVSFTASGGKMLLVSQAAPGPPNVIARIFGLTGSGGSNYFVIPATPQDGTQVVGSDTVLQDNVSTTAILDFADNTLFGAEAIDIDGNNLFNQIVLAPCLGVQSFASRLLWHGELNNLKDFLNMGFEGGSLDGVNPSGWDVVTPGGALVNSPSDFGMAWKITGDGSANARGQLSQGAFQNALLNEIVEPTTRYTFWVWAQKQLDNQAGAIRADLYSPTAGVLASAQIPLANVSLVGSFVKANFDVATPAVIPSDTVLRIYALNLANNQWVVLDENMLVFTDQPYNDNVFRCSYSLATGSSAESYDGVSGTMGPESDDSPIRDSGKIWDALCFVTANELHEVRDNDAEPGDWDVKRRQGKVGGVSPRCMCQGPDWLAWVSQNDSELSLVLYVAGGDAQVISQEIQPNFSLINQDAMQSIWCVNDAGSKRIYIGAPFNDAVLPTAILPMDYRSLPNAEAIVGSSPIRVGMMGKQVATDRVRKWTVWNLPMYCGAILHSSLQKKEFRVGSGGVGFGNSYFLDPAFLTDDDYGPIDPFWTSSFFVDHDKEQMLPVGVHRKLFDKLAIFITGVGYLQLTPLANRIDNPVPLTSRMGGALANMIALKQNLKSDIEIPGEVSAERVAFRIGVKPIPQGSVGYTNGTDVQFNMGHFSCRMQQHPVSPLAGRAGA